ncbi:MAG: hypothetical protein RBS30_10285 [Sphaerochaetaceae bacterium]|jgi:hypothetical protein|nr:hypothetical protein [Sphaerochaetaceae bacterium]
MKHRLASTLVIVLIVLGVVLLAGCATTVRVRHLVPAQIDMSDYRGVALASTEPYNFGFLGYPPSTVRDYTGNSGYKIATGFGYFTESQVARYVTNEILRGLNNTDYFTVLPPAQTDTIIKGKNLGYTTAEMFTRNGITALFTNSIDFMDIEEYIYAIEKEMLVTVHPGTGAVLNPAEKHIVKTYHLMQKVAVTFTYEITDVRTGRSVLSKTQTVRRERTYDLTGKPLTGYVAPSLQPWIESMLDEIIDPLVYSIAPRWETSYLSLMPNKPEISRLEFAWEEVRRGNLGIAKEAFIEEWNKSQHIPSGYNAALLMEALGDIDEGIALMDQVYRRSGNSNVYGMLLKMRQRAEDQKRAETQMGF